MLIVFEGIDGSGKNTQIAALLAFLQQSGVKHRLYKYPSARAKDVFRHLQGKKTLRPEKLAEIFAADILADREKVGRETDSGTVVICDRYLHSTLAYQGVKVGYGRLKKKLSVLGAITPDIVFLLDLDPKVSAKRKRAQKKPDRFEKDVPFLSRVRENYRKMAGQGFLSYKYAVIDAEQEQEKIFTEIITQVEPLVTKKMGRKN
ncbi:TPA: dTMP kinase [Candidatus Micrarchaeota archaeon]|nr:dTMP kinase [Candidatus Micrarchaeota archaeon]HIH30665.1 dTMP kinase [Candidatus Micrarchaeota archaeon]